MKKSSISNVVRRDAGCRRSIVSPEGKHLATILTPELVANVEFGDPDHKTLYIATRTSVYKIRVNAAGTP